MERGFDGMMGEHAAAGRLQSGATIKAAVGIFEEETRTALDQTLSEAAKLIEHRGHSWRAAMRGTREALDQHLARSGVYLERPRSTADRLNSPAASEAMYRLIHECQGRLRERLTEFEQGWTAPTPKHWRDRQPLTYALTLVLLGAVAGAAVSATVDALRDAPAPPRAASQ